MGISLVSLIQLESFIQKKKNTTWEKYPGSGFPQLIYEYWKFYKLI